MHWVPLGQTLPQAPQLALSVWRLAHVVPQLVCPVVQYNPHVPPAQMYPAGHLWPQVPQLAGSVWILVHAPLQFVSPD